MYLFNEKGEQQSCRCDDPGSFEPIHGERDENEEVCAYQCLVCGVRRDGYYWGEE